MHKRDSSTRGRCSERKWKRNPGSQRSKKSFKGRRIGYVEESRDILLNIEVKNGAEEPFFLLRFSSKGDFRVTAVHCVFFPVSQKLAGKAGRFNRSTLNQKVMKGLLFLPVEFPQLRILGGQVFSEIKRIQLKQEEPPHQMG